jgi:hypothetical protein
MLGGRFADCFDGTKARTLYGGTAGPVPIWPGHRAPRGGGEHTTCHLGCQLFDVKEGCEGHGLDDLLVTAGVAAEPDALIKGRDMRECHALPSIDFGFGVPGHAARRAGV